MESLNYNYRGLSLTSGLLSELHFLLQNIMMTTQICNSDLCENGADSHNVKFAILIVMWKP